MQLPAPLAALAAYRQFIVWKSVPNLPKPDKIPINPHTGRAYPKGSDWQKNPAENCTDYETAKAVATILGPGYDVGFLLTPDDPFFLLDLDGCRNPTTGDAEPWSQTILQQFPGLFFEISTSGTGFHIIGTGRPTAPHRNRSRCGNLEFYTEYRFIAVTGWACSGDAGALAQPAALDWLAQAYLQPTPGDAGTATAQEWTAAPAAGYGGPAEDVLLWAAALDATAAPSAATAFGGAAPRATLLQLVTGDADALGAAFPVPAGDVRPYDASRADAALAQHLAFWAGNDCERIERMMRETALVRDKWGESRRRGTYLQETILNACGRQTAVYTGAGMAAEAADDSLPKLRGSERQVTWAQSIRAGKIAELGPDTPEAEQLTREQNAKWWIDNKDRDTAELAAALKPVETVTENFSEQIEPREVTGYQYLASTQQLELFKGCAYILDADRIFTPNGMMLKRPQFNAAFGGYTFQLDDAGRKTTTEPWVAFTNSQIIRFPKVHGACFRPHLKAGEVIKHEGRLLMNTYAPIETESAPGDVTPFLGHLEKLIPNKEDREILLSYLAACVQHRGTKFQWCPLIQGVEGNGKTFLFEALSYAIGQRYSHTPEASNLQSPFNAWIENKLLICIEEIHVRGRVELADRLKPLITNRRIEIQAKGIDQRTGDNFANFLTFSNHKDAVLKTRNDRRYAVFFSAQQEADDLKRDGMTGRYFPELYQWLRADGHKHITDYLANYPIPDKLNPAVLCDRAPDTSSTEEAIIESFGPAEQTLRDAVELEKPGFRGELIDYESALLYLKNNGRPIGPRAMTVALHNLGYIRHPVSPDGRIRVDGFRRRIYVKRGSIPAQLPTAKSVADYLKKLSEVSNHGDYGAVSNE